MEPKSTKKFNILYHHRTQGRGAEGVHITSIVRSLESMGHTVTVLSPPGIDPMSNAGNAPVDKSKVKTTGINSFWKFVSKNLPNFLFEFAEIAYNIPAMKRLEKELSTNHYDLIYERYAFYMIAGAIKSKKYHIPLVLEANEVNGIKDRARKQSFPWICNRFEKFLFNRTCSIHTVSSYLKSLIMNQGVDDSKIHVTPNAIDPDKFSGKTNNAELLEKYHLKDKCVIGFAGWFDNWDRLDLLYSSFIELKKKHENLALLLIGDGEVLNGIRESASQSQYSSDIVFTGPVNRNEVHNYLSMLDIAVITHSNEFGSPVVMFEFMGLKIPIVAPALLPITDVLAHNETALIFDILNMEQMRNCISSLIEDSNLSSRIADAAHEKLLRDHTWDSNAEDILKSAGLIEAS